MNYKIFSGKRYKLAQRYNTRRQAITHAKRLRSEGDNARVTKEMFTYAKPAYEVWYNSKR